MALYLVLLLPHGVALPDTLHFEDTKMNRFAGAAFLLTAFAHWLLQSSVVAQEAPDYISAFAEESRLQRPNALADVDRRIAAIRENAQRAINLGQSKGEAMRNVQAVIKSVKAEAAKISNAREPFYASLSPDGLKIGSIGRLDWTNASVFQVIDEKNMLVEFEWLVPVMKSVNPGEAATSENVYAGVESETSLLWVRGMNTEGLVDGKGLDFQGVSPHGVFAVRKTQTYETRLGSKTVPVLEEIDMKPWSHLFTLCGEQRTWRDKTGNHSVEASFVDYKGGSVQLFGLDRKNHKLSLKDLSEEDQSYVREQMRMRRELQ